MKSVVVAWCLSLSLASALEIEVSPEVGALSKAMEAVRKANKSEPVTVILHPGRYDLEAPLVFTPEDSGTKEAPVTWLGREGAVISGGIRFGGFQAGADGIWTAKVPAAVTKHGRFTQLFVNGRRAVRAREPDVGYFYATHVNEEKLSAKGPAARQTIGVRIPAGDLLSRLTGEELRRADAIFYHKWDNTWRTLAGYDAASSAFVIEGRIMKSWNPLKGDTRFHIEHIQAAVDEPGEWFFGVDGTLHYKPRAGEHPEGSEAVVPILEQVLVIKGDAESHRLVEHLRFENLRFHHAAYRLPAGGFGPMQAASELEAAVQIDGARNLSFTDCRFEHLGLYAMWFRQGCSNSRVERCLVKDLGAGGVRIGEMRHPRNEAEATHHITVHNNIIAQGGRLFPCAVGVWIGYSPDNTVSHNEVADFFYSGLSVGWRWGYTNSNCKRNRVTYNHVHHIGQSVLSDMGGIYTLGPSEGTRIDHNIFHDIYSYNYGGWGLYTDEGSSQIVMENNLVYNTKSGGFHQHYGRDNLVRNNILAFAKDQQVQYTRVEKHRSFSFVHNIVYWDEGEVFSGRWKEGLTDVDSNCYWRVGGGAFEFAGETLEARQARGQDLKSVIADPNFSDPANRRFDVPPDSPALAVGFKPFDLSRAGVMGEAWRKVAKDLPMPAYAQPPEPPK